MTDSPREDAPAFVAADARGHGPSPRGHGPSPVPLAFARLSLASGAAMVVFGGCVAVGPACLPRIGEELRLSFAQRGFIESALMGALLVSLLLVGHFAELKGKRPFLVTGMAVMAAGVAAVARSPGYLALLVSNGLVGSGKGAMEALVNPLVAELDPATAPRRLNLINGLFSVGVVVAALSAGQMLQAGLSWRSVYALWIIPAAVVAWLFSARGYPRPQRLSPGGTATENPALRFLRMPLFWVLVVGMAMGGGAEAGMTFWGANFTAHEFGASDRAGAFTVALFGAFMALGRFATGWLVSRVRPLLLMQVSAATCALATAGLYFVQGLYGAWALYALGGLFVACFWPTLLAVAAQEIESGSSTLFALLAAAGIAGCVILPGAIGAIGDAAGLRAGSLMLPLSMLLEGAALLVAARMVARAAPA